MIQEFIDKYNAKIDTPEAATKALNQGFWGIIASAMISLAFFQISQDAGDIGDALFTAAFAVIILKTKNRPVTIGFYVLSFLVIINMALNLAKMPGSTVDGFDVLEFFNGVLCFWGATRVVIAVYRGKSIAEG